MIPCIFSGDSSRIHSNPQATPIYTATLGFLMYFRTQKAKADIVQYPPLAALGIMMSAIAIPLTFAVKKLLAKVGPSED